MRNVLRLLALGLAAGIVVLAMNVCRLVRAYEVASCVISAAQAVR
jgi:hypothetical protein